jgi:hypothetical protein
MEASNREASAGRYVDLSRLSPAEFIGMGASLVLLGSLFLPWFSTSGDNPNARINGQRGDFNAWDTFGTLDWLLLSACAAPFILSWIIVRGHALTWHPGEVTMFVGILYFVLILCNGVILGKPGEPESEISYGIGYLVGLLGAAGIAAGGLVRQALYAKRKPPGVL